MSASSAQPPCITLTTDFGLQDGFAGAMHGVIHRICPAATVIDLSHDIPPQDIAAAAYVLAAGYAYFAPGSIHVVVVDPGVGSDRAVLLLETGDYFFLAPDNGVLTTLIRQCDNWTLRHVTNRAYCLPETSRTFHGRDIFAPVAAHLANGVAPDTVGPATTEYVTREVRGPQGEGGTLTGHIRYIDHFGNGITDIRLSHLQSAHCADACTIIVGDTTLQGIRQCYAEGRDGEPLALINSAGWLEIAVPGARAADILGLNIGAAVRVMAP